MMHRWMLSYLIGSLNLACCVLSLYMTDFWWVYFAANSFCVVWNFWFGTVYLLQWLDRRKPLIGQ